MRKSAEQAPQRNGPGGSARSVGIQEARPHPVLQFQGQRVYDVEDIPALIALNVIPLYIRRGHELLQASGKIGYTSESDRHLAEHGHELEFGCCGEAA